MPPRYEPAWTPGEGPRNAEALAAYSVALADRLEPLLAPSPVVVGGDCAVLVGEMLALRRRGRFGLAFIDGHGDSSHHGNGVVEAAAGEDLAIVTGRGDPRLVDLEGYGPSVLDLRFGRPLATTLARELGALAHTRG